MTEGIHMKSVAVGFLACCGLFALWGWHKSGRSDSGCSKGACQCNSAADEAKGSVVRRGGTIKVRPGKLAEYKKLHAAVWPDILRRLHQSNIRNFTIYHRDGVLFSHMEYVGTDFDADVKAIAEDPRTREWWKVCEPCQEPYSWKGRPPSAGGNGGGGEWWATMEEVFHDGHPAASYK